MKCLSFCLSLLLVAALASCEGLSDPDLETNDQPLSDLQEQVYQKTENPFLGSWRLESAEVGDEEQDLGAISMIYSFMEDGSYSVQVSEDVDHLMCESPLTSCGWIGTYTYTRTVLTTDESGGPEPGEDNTGYVFCSGRLILVDTAVRLTAVRTRRDCYVQDCDT